MATKPQTASADEMIHSRGFRMTEQRRAVYDTLMGERDHPTAVEVFMRVKRKVPNISLATVYNCLDTLSGCGLVKTVAHEREPSRFCPNLEEHAHFFCQTCGSVTDLPLRARKRPEEVWVLPENLSIEEHEISFRGVCPKCATRSSGKTAAAAKKR